MLRYLFEVQHLQPFRVHAVQQARLAAPRRPGHVAVTLQGTLQVMLQVTLQVTASPRPRCRPRGGHVTGHAGPDAITQGQGGSTDPLTTLKVNLEASVLRFSICGTTISTGQVFHSVVLTSVLARCRYQRRALVQRDSTTSLRYVLYPP